MIAVCLASFMALLDVNIVITALPSIQADLDSSDAAVQWVINAYTLCLSTVALSAGSLGDRYGRKRMFLIGVTLFTVGSACCGLAAGAGVLLAGRFAQGVGAAIALPGALSLVAQGFPDSAQRARMLGLLATSTGVAGLCGPTLGGLLIEAFGWQAIFLINLPIGAVALFAAVRSIHESADPEHAALDPAGQVLGILWLGALSFGLINAGQHGFTTATTIVALAVAATALAAFLAVELRQANPMLPVRWFAGARFAVPCVVSLLLGCTAFTLITLVPSYLQQAQGHTALGSALLLLPASVVGVLVPTLAGRWVARSGPRAPMATGLALIACCALLLLAERPDSGFLLTAGAMLLLGAGTGLVLTPANAAVLAAVSLRRTGTASATVNAMRQGGTTLGIAVLGSLLVAGIDHRDTHTAALTHSSGLHLISGIAAALAVAGALLAVLAGARTTTR